MNALGDVSFLIGSGFSGPAGYPTASKLNQRLAKISEHEICIHSSGNAWFLEGQKNLNAAWMHLEDRLFVQEFLEFYQSALLMGSGAFDYETFYDYYRRAIEGNRCPKELVPFFRDFRARHIGIIGSNEHLLQNFHKTFSQLIANLLSKPPQRSHLCKPYHPSYEKFLLLVERLGKSNRVHFHTLNHDLWFERLAISDSMHAEMDDGFAELGSPYYGEMDSREELYLVRLSWFTNKFTRRFRLYKLHGSIDRYWFGGGTAADLIKVKWGVSHMRLYREILLKGKLQYIDDNGNFYPDFLTGTTHKIEKYRLGKYYPAIFRHFERNLARSHTLIVIGYGFRDSRINEYIEKHFLDGTSKSVFVVDIAQPVWSPFSSKRVHFLGNGVSGMDTEFILKRLPRASKSA